LPSGIQPSILCAIVRIPGTAITAHSKPSVPRVSRGAVSVAVSMRRCWIGSEAITRPKRTRRRIVNARCGLNRYSLRAKTGTVCAVFACDGCGASTVRHSCVQQDNTSNACSKSEAGDGVPTQQRPCVASFWLFLACGLVFFRCIGLVPHRYAQLLNTYEAMHCSFLMSFVRAFFNRLVHFATRERGLGLIPLQSYKKLR